MSAIGMKRSFVCAAVTSAFGGKADMSRSGLVLCKVTRETHFAGHKSLL
jgi:hypothetical protein